MPTARVLPSAYLRRSGEVGEVVKIDPYGPFPVVLRFDDGGQARYWRREVEIADDAPAPEPAPAEEGGGD